MTDPINERRRQAALPTASELLALTSRPTRVIAHPAWSAAREKALALVTAGPATVLVLGAPGTGKTALLRDLAATFGDRGRAACLLEFGDGPQDIGPADIVLVDEADRMSTSRLDELRRRGDLAIILAALPAGAKRFAPYPDVTVVRLTPLSPYEARVFLIQRLSQVLLPGESLTEAACMRLIAYGRGVPRLLLTLLRLALLLAGEEHAERVTEVHVKQALEAQSGSAEPSTAEPAHADANVAPRDPPELPANPEDTSAETALAWISKTPDRRSNGAVATALVIAYSVVVVGLLTWGHLRWIERPASGSEAAATARTTLSADDGLPQASSGRRRVSDVPVSTSIAVTKIGISSTQPDIPSSASAGSFQQQATAVTQPPTVAVATRPLGANAPSPAWAVALPHRCTDGNWTWSTCGAPARRIVWRRVRHCAITLGNLCLGVSYNYERVR